MVALNQKNSETGRAPLNYGIGGLAIRLCAISIFWRGALKLRHSLNADICACFTQPQDCLFMKAA
jgi:hypothetical protein